MRTPRYLTLLFGIFAIAVLSSCSRESSVKEDVSLKHNNSRVFAQRVPFSDPQAFLDSIANTPFNERDSIPDTLTVTINDSVYVIGILPRNVDKVHHFRWIFTDSAGKDVQVKSHNAEPASWAYAKPGVYYPLFIAIDDNNATDTAGTETKRIYVKVIDSQPNLSVPKDTLWTSNKGDVTFPITASDSFGTIKKILVDLDASGKAEPQEWKYETKENNDSLYLTIKNDSKYIDSLGNQKIYVIIEDDDHNQKKDSVNLHFNRIPKLKVLYPMDGARHSITSRFYFYYEGSDLDNPQDLKYFIYAQVSKNGQPPAKAFDSRDLIAEDYAGNIFDCWKETETGGANSITLVNDPSKELSGRIYWDMYVTDGYDITRLERISTGDNTSRPWNFYIGDIKATQGSISGVAQYQGRTDHSGINIELNSGVKVFTGVTDAKGIYSIKVDAGSYNVIATSPIAEFTSDTLKELYMESGAVLTADSMLLKDTVAPMILVKNFDTLNVRSLKQTVYVRDLGAYVKSVSAKHNDTPLKLTCSSAEQGAIFNCEFTLDSLEDGTHHFSYTATDNVDHSKTLTQDIVINATSMTLDVNGVQKHIIGETEKLTFNAKVINALPAADSVTWEWNVGDKPYTKKTAVAEDGTTSMVLTYDDIKDATEKVDYIMTASYSKKSVSVSAQVKFGVLGNDPAIAFTEPGFTTTVTKNDKVDFKVATFPGVGTTSMTISWDCGTNLSTGYTCPTNESEAQLAFSEIGTHKVIATVTDNRNLTGTDTVTVVVISDPPSIKVSNNDQKNEYKINAIVPVSASASDKFGTINKIEWGCSNGEILSYDNDTTFAAPTQSVSDVKLQIRLPGTTTNNFKCKFKAIDDDGEFSFDSLTFKTLLDPPTLKLSVKRDTVKINSKQTIKANASDKLGYIKEFDYACGENPKSLPDWETSNSAVYTVMMPNYATNVYCAVQVVDDDGNTARDTAVYTVLVGRPTVDAVLASAYETVTIKDTIELNAIAQDSLGEIVKYEWGCGPASSENIGFTITSSTTPHAFIAVPSTPQDKYICIVRVTDDDNNTAFDTVATKVILAPPTIEVLNNSLTVRENFNIALNAVASDNNKVSSDPGEIVKREWSCGSPADIDANWKKVSDFDTVWKAPAPQPIFYCIARATDNDGNSVMDTVNIKFTTEQPLIWVRDEKLYLNVGDKFSLSATVNDVWQGIDWFTWECTDKSGKSLEKDGKVPKYDYNKNGGNMTIGKDSSYTEHGVDMYCIVSAQETSTKATFKDTTEIHILKQHPQGVITAADTVYLWSGDDNVDDNAKYFYTPKWGGMNSIMGELGDKNNLVFRWRFDNLGTNYYQGPSTGILDTSISQFNSAFIRSKAEGVMTIYLDFRDSSTDTPTQAFYSRHRAEEVTHKVYFRKAWKNLSQDTVIESTGTLTTAPSITVLNDVPVEAYLTDEHTVKVVRLVNNEWTQIGTKSVDNNITQTMLTNNGTDLYLGVLDNGNNFTVFKSSNGTSAFSKVGDPITNAVSPQVICNPSNGDVLAVYVDATSKRGYRAIFNGSTWNATPIATKITNRVLRTDDWGNPQYNNGQEIYDNKEVDAKFREIRAEFVNGNLVIIAIDVSSDYNAHYFIYNSSYEKKAGPTFFEANVSKITLAHSGSNLYMGFLNRDVNNYGPYIYEGTVASNSISWNKTSSAFTKPIYEGYIAYHMSIVTYDGSVFVALDDNGKHENSQIHVFQLKGNKWHFYGENELPYFGETFYKQKKNNYYLRGSSPILAIDGEGKIYLSMLAWESAHGDRTKNNGPLVMKYVADNWEIN